MPDYPPHARERKCPLPQMMPTVSSMTGTASTSTEPSDPYGSPPRTSIISLAGGNVRRVQEHLPGGYRSDSSEHAPAHKMPGCRRYGTVCPINRQITSVLYHLTRQRARRVRRAEPPPSTLIASGRMCSGTLLPTGRKGTGCSRLPP